MLGKNTGDHVGQAAIYNNAKTPKWSLCLNASNTTFFGALKSTHLPRVTGHGGQGAMTGDALTMPCWGAVQFQAFTKCNGACADVNPI